MVNTACVVAMGWMGRDDLDEEEEVGSEKATEPSFVPAAIVAAAESNVMLCSVMAFLKKVQRGTMG